MNMPNFPNLADTFYNYFQNREHKGSPDDGTITFAPSYLMDCSRKIYYKKTGEVESNPIDLPALFKMHFGTLQHEGLQNILIELGMLIECEDLKKAEYDGLTFYYKLDSIINWNGEKVIVEIKTVYAAGFDSVVDRPKDDHLVQALSYMAFEGIKKAIIVYVGRDNGLIRQYCIESGENLLLNGAVINDYRPIWKSRIEAMKTLKDDIENKQLPLREYNIVMKSTPNGISYMFTKDKIKYKGNWQCSYCSFKDKCWREEIEKMQSGKYSFYIDGEFIE